MANRPLTVVSFPLNWAHTHIGSDAVTAINAGWPAQGKLTSFTQVLRGTLADITCDTQSTILASWRTGGYNVKEKTKRLENFINWFTFEFDAGRHL